MTIKSATKKDMTKEEFEEMMQDTDKDVVLVDFWAEWCGPCRMLAKVLEAVDKSVGDKMDILKVDVDENPQIASDHDVMGIPALVLYKGGKQVDRSVGLKSEKDLLKWVKKVGELS